MGEITDDATAGSLFLHRSYITFPRNELMNTVVQFMNLSSSMKSICLLAEDAAPRSPVNSCVPLGGGAGSLQAERRPAAVWRAWARGPRGRRSSRERTPLQLWEMKMLRGQAWGWRADQSPRKEQEQFLTTPHPTPSCLAGPGGGIRGSSAVIRTQGETSPLQGVYNST